MSLNNRYDFVYLFDVKDGNPNGDPDAGNMPRVDPETGQGLVTDVCLKRKIRNFFQLNKPNEEGLSIFVRSKELSGEETVLNKIIREAHEELGHDLKSAKDRDGKDRKTSGKAQGSEITRAREFLCENFVDIRMFGAVMSTGPNAGQVRGPVQLTFSRSIDPVIASEHSISVSAARKEEDSYESQIGIQGRKATVPYGLYRCHGFISAHLAAQTGFNDNDHDLVLFWQALLNMFDHDRSAARGEMTARCLYVFRHDSKLGNARAHALFDRIEIAKDTDEAPRAFTDYRISVNKDDMPAGVQLITEFA